MQQIYEDYLNRNPKEPISYSYFVRKMNEGMTIDEVVEFRKKGYAYRQKWEEYKLLQPKEKRIHKHYFHTCYKKEMPMEEILKIKPRIRKKYNKFEGTRIEGREEKPEDIHVILQKANRKRLELGWIKKGDLWLLPKKKGNTPKK